MVDALCSGRSVRKDVLVRIQSRAQTSHNGRFFFFILVVFHLFSFVDLFMLQKSVMFFVYSLKSLSRNYIYVGLTDSVERRFEEH